MAGYYANKTPDWKKYLELLGGSRLVSLKSSGVSQYRRVLRGVDLSRVNGLNFTPVGWGLHHHLFFSSWGYPDSDLFCLVGRYLSTLLLCAKGGTYLPSTHILILLLVGACPL